LPWPSWPLPFSPQHSTSPELNSAQLCSRPRLTWMSLASPGRSSEWTSTVPVTDGGSFLLIPLVWPKPSCPRPFSPQHRSSKLVVMAQLWSPPAAIAAAPTSTPRSTTLAETGCSLSPIAWLLPSPSWPSLLRPQQRSSLLAKRPQPWKLPSASSTTTPPTITLSKSARDSLSPSLVLLA